MQTSWRSRCRLGNKGSVKLRLSIEAVQDAYSPTLEFRIKREDTDTQDVVVIPYEVAVKLHAKLGKQLEHMMEGH